MSRESRLVSRRRASRIEKVKQVYDPDCRGGESCKYHVCRTVLLEMMYCDAIGEYAVRICNPSMEINPSAF